MAENTAFNWDSTIGSNAQEQDTGFKPLPEGDYEFVINSVTKKIYNGSAKMPACPQASIEIHVDDPTTGRTVPVFTNLFLCSSQEWKLTQFFKAIGVMSPNDKQLRMRWNIEGERGICHIAPREYNGKQYNDIKKWLAPAKKEKPVIKEEDLPF